MDGLTYVRGLNVLDQVGKVGECESALGELAIVEQKHGHVIIVWGWLPSTTCSLVRCCVVVVVVFTSLITTAITHHHGSTDRRSFNMES